MKLTRSWLETYVDIPTSVEKLSHQLTMAGLEVDNISNIEDDYLIDIDLTPNRSDCLSVYGISRELHCINDKYKFKANKKKQKINSNCATTKTKFNILENKICPRYCYMSLTNLSLSCLTPDFINKRLNDIGIKLIHPIVDILNYIMIDIGQPMHAYDADKINGDITIRMAKKNESIKALDGNQYVLSKDNVVVSDKKNILSLAGIIGAEECSVTKSTKNIIIESAFFLPDFIANKGRKLKLQTESSHRFERGVDFNLPEKALIELRNILFNNKICNFSDIITIDNKNYFPVRNKVSVDFDKIRKTIGIPINNDEIIKIFLSIGCNYNKKDKTVVSPSYRYDLNIHADYIEEVARVYGYDRISLIPEKISSEFNKKYLPFKIVNEIKNYLYKNSFSECLNYSFVSSDKLENMDWKNHDFNNHYNILNHMSLEQNRLRTNLVSSLIKNIEYNNDVNFRNSYRFFEISNVFGKTIDQVLTCVVSGQRYEVNWSGENKKFDKYDMSQIIEDISMMVGIYKKELNYVIKDFEVKEKEYITLTLSISDLVSVIKKNSRMEKFENFSKLPYIRRDLSFIVSDTVGYSSILEVIHKINVHSLKKILLFDMYRGKNIPENNISFGIGFIFQEKTKTLTHQEVDRYIKLILDGLISKYKIVLRSI